MPRIINLIFAFCWDYQCVIVWSQWSWRPRDLASWCLKYGLVLILVASRTTACVRYGTRTHLLVASAAYLFLIIRTCGECEMRIYIVQLQRPKSAWDGFGLLRGKEFSFFFQAPLGRHGSKWELSLSSPAWPAGIEMEACRGQNGRVLEPLSHSHVGLKPVWTS